MTAAQWWARMRDAPTGGLRLGAWYPVTTLTAREAYVSVHRRVAKVARSLLEFRATPPQDWTVVLGQVLGALVPGSARDGYLVCPNCRHRDTLPDTRVSSTRCSRCNQLSPVTWHEPYPRRAGRRQEVPVSPPLPLSRKPSVRIVAWPEAVAALNAVAAQGAGG